MKDMLPDVVSRVRWKLSTSETVALESAYVGVTSITRADEGAMPYSTVMSSMKM